MKFNKLVELCKAIKRKFCVVETENQNLALAVFSDDGKLEYLNVIGLRQRMRKLDGGR